jgi:hypothetical protein
MSQRQRKFYKTKVVVEVLHEGPIEFDNLRELQALIDDDCSGKYVIHSAEPLTGKQMAEEAIAQGSDPEFFQIDENGTDT